MLCTQPSLCNSTTQAMISGIIETQKMWICHPQDKGPIIQLETLHRRDCPCVAHAKQPTKKAKTSHRPFTEDDGPSAQAHNLQHIDCKRPDAAADVKTPSKRARFAGA